MEWKLWEGDNPPEFTQPDFFTNHPKIDGSHQIGYFQRMDMVHRAVLDLHEIVGFPTLTDLGCGDGYFLSLVKSSLPNLNIWGYDLSVQNIEYAKQHRGLKVEMADITENVPVGVCITLTEVLEHIPDPHKYLRNLNERLRSLGNRYLIATSPLIETDTWHYEHHAWAWDSVGYYNMLESCGWVPVREYNCVADRPVQFPPSWESKNPEFQCIVAERK